MTKSRDLGNLAQTVAVNLPTSLGTAGQTLVVNSGADGLEFGAASSGSGVTVYTGLSGTDGTPSGATYLLNASSPSAGDLAYVSSNTSLYQNNGNGWYRIAVINTTPTISSVADASSNTTPFTLEGGTNTVITVTASDADEGTDLTYSYSVTSGSLNGTTVTQGTGASENVFTIASHASNATTFSLTFTVSDSINAATSVAEFTLEFQITDSHYTTLLMATDGSQGDNSTITYDTGSSTGNSLTVVGDPHAGTFSPYRHGGYSTHLDGSGDYINAPSSHSSFALGTNDFTYECWFYPQNLTGCLVSKHSTGAPQWFELRVSSGYIYVGIAFSNSWGPMQTGTIPVPENKWCHVALVRNGSSFSVFVNGVLDTGISISNTGSISNNTSYPFRIGARGAADLPYNGYISDARLVNGTALYTSNFTPPTEPLTAVTNTSLLTCHLPYIADGSSNAHAITVNGDPETKPFGPYDYAEYSASDNGGSVYFDGSGDYIGVGSAIVPTAYDTDYTIEMWIYPTTTGSREDIFNQYAATASGRMAININTDATISFFQNGLSPAETKSSAISANKWYHLAVVNSSGTRSFYVNGSLIGTATGTVSMYSGNTEIGRLGDVGSNYFTGYITDVRVVNGTAVYSGAFAPPTGPLTTTGGTYPSTTNVNTSITASNTSLLLKGTDAHVIDKSQVSNLKLFGGAAASTTQAKFSNTASVYFDGNGDYVSLPDISLSGDLTIEGWFYQSVAQSATYRCVIGASTYANTNSPLRIYTYGSIYSIWLSNTGGPHISGSFTANTWHHVALVRSSGTWTLYIDGTSAGTSTTNGTYNFASTADWTIGADSANTYPFTGYAQDVRISNGKARYTSNFTVPSSPLKG